MSITPTTTPPVALDQSATAQPGPFEVSPAQGGAQIAFLRRGVQPPSNVYIVQDDLILVSIVNSVAGLEVDIQGRILEPSGRIIPFSQALFPPADGAVHNYSVGLAEGFLLTAVASTPSAVVLRGQVYVSLAIGRIQASIPLTLALLASDYITQGSLVGWPNGHISPPQVGPGFTNVISTSSPPLSVNGSFTVPAGQVWRVLAADIALTAAGVAPNCQPAYTVSSTLGEVFGYVATASIAPSTSYFAAFVRGLGFEQAALQGQFVALPLPDIPLQPGWNITFNQYHGGTSAPVPSAADIVIEQLLLY